MHPCKSVCCFFMSYLRQPLPPLLILSTKGWYSALCAYTSSCYDGYVLGFGKHLTEFRHV